MPTFVVERHVPGVGSRTQEDLRKTAASFRAVAEQLSSEIIWIRSYVTENTMYCVVSAPDRTLIRLHGRRTGFPADQISAVREILEPDGLGLVDS